ncbi:MAG: WG repeat-containing protein [Bacteroidetes bacterium]|nr:WG repeat-containing protein [Bacteroidota bacterium]
MIYDYAWIFSGGLAVVGKNDKFGLIDRRGNIILPLICDTVWSFTEGLAVVEKNDNYGCGFG